MAAMKKENIKINNLICGDTLIELKKLPNNSIDTIITSPPYWGLRDYGNDTKTIWSGGKDCKHEWFIERTLRSNTSGGQGEASKKQHTVRGSLRTNYYDRADYSNFCQNCGAWHGQLGLEPTLDLYITHLLQITSELKRILKPTGVLFWNHGDSYGGSGGGTSSKTDPNNRNRYPSTKESIGLPFGKAVLQNKNPKCMMLQNYRLITQMIDQQGWILRNSIIWNKPNHMPSSVKDRFSNGYEPIFMLTKSKKYWFDLDIVRIPHTTQENRPYGIVREREFGYNTKYPQVRQTKIPQNQAENFGSPRARYHRKTKMEALRETGMVRHGDTEQGSTLGNPEKWNSKGKNPGDVWKIATQPFSEAHFATFPEKLIEPMVKSSCPKWICKKCGKARVRISKVDYVPHRKAKNLSKTRAKSIGPQHCAMDSQGKVCLSKHQTIGWTDCGCNIGWEAGIVLDPFSGAGTTCVVAKKLGINFIGIDIKEEYCKIAEKRLKNIIRGRGLARYE